MKKRKKDPLLYKEYREESHINLTPTQTALVIDYKGSVTMHFGRDLKPEDVLQWPELLLASVLVAIGENDVAAVSAAMEYASVKLKRFERERKNAKVRLHRAGHKRRRIYKREERVRGSECRHEGCGGRGRGSWVDYGV